VTQFSLIFAIVVKLSSCQIEQDKLSYLKLPRIFPYCASISWTPCIHSIFKGKSLTFSFFYYISVTLCILWLVSICPIVFLKLVSIFLLSKVSVLNAESSTHLYRNEHLNFIILQTFQVPIYFSSGYVICLSVLDASFQSKPKMDEWRKELSRNKTQTLGKVKVVC